ncbi:hypothetical protein H5410_013490 [Solanum commersonii]|uniref:Uncharacterized protein n=1 Tax=Solanum commersonii TaxID=4109 RepID=A0A9J6AUS8_SOLCO|nr:hypothetical protein H5410_013490 [Solanum commersonii]
MMELKQARRNNGDGDRHREHLGDLFLLRQSASVMILIYLFFPFDTADPRQYYPNYRRPVEASSTLQALPPRRYKDLLLQAIRRPQPLSANRISDGTPSSTASVYSSILTSSTAAHSATPDAEMPTLAPGQKDRFGRVMIEPDGSSWHLAKDATRDLKDRIRRFYTQAYHSWSEIPNSIHQAMFNEFKEKELGRTLIEPEVFKKTHVKKKENESDPDVWVEERNEFHQYVAENLDSSQNDIRRLQSGLEGIGSSRQEEALDTQLTSVLTESKRRRVAEQQSMSVIVQEIKEQVLNLTRRPTTSSLVEDTDDDSDEDDDFVDRTP